RAPARSGWRRRRSRASRRRASGSTSAWCGCPGRLAWPAATQYLLEHTIPLAGRLQPVCCRPRLRVTGRIVAALNRWPGRVCWANPLACTSAMDAIRTLVVDDEKPAQTRLLELLQRDHDIKIVGVARDGGEALELIRAQTPQLMFLDIQMPVLDGFGVLKETTPNNRPATVFVTAYDTDAIQAFEAHALDYLLKPYSDELFATALNRVCH